MELKTITGGWLLLTLAGATAACSGADDAPREATAGVAQAAVADPIAFCQASGLNVIIGTPNDDILQGTAEADCIVALEGQDTVNGLGGNDVIFGSAGDDVIDAGDGNDQLFG